MRPLWDLPDWMPRTGETLPRPCGQDFDAVRVAADLAVPALTALGSNAGPVLANHTTRTYFFLVKPGSVLPGRWTLGVRVMPRGAIIGIPRSERPAAGTSTGPYPLAVAPPTPMI